MSHDFAPPQEMNGYISRSDHSIQLQLIPWTVWNKDSLCTSDPFWSKNNFCNSQQHALHPASMSKCLALRLGFPQSLIHTVAATQDDRLMTGQWWHSFSKRANKTVEMWRFLSVI
jgi:hypothetical protein